MQKTSPNPPSGTSRNRAPSSPWQRQGGLQTRASQVSEAGQGANHRILPIPIPQMRELPQQKFLRPWREFASLFFITSSKGAKLMFINSSVHTISSPTAIGSWQHPNPSRTRKLSGSTALSVLPYGWENGLLLALIFTPLF